MAVHTQPPLPTHRTETNTSVPCNDMTSHAVPPPTNSGRVGERFQWRTKQNVTTAGRVRVFQTSKIFRMRKFLQRAVGRGSFLIDHQHINPHNPCSRLTHQSRKNQQYYDIRMTPCCHRTNESKRRSHSHQRQSLLRPSQPKCGMCAH
jgi:hypothetical protein